MKGCELGCVRFTCGSTRHLKACINYPESMTELLDDANARNEKLENLIRAYRHNLENVMTYELKGKRFTGQAADSEVTTTVGLFIEHTDKLLNA